MEKFYFIEGMKPVAKPAEVEVQETPKLIVHKFSVSAQISEETLKKVVDKLFFAKLAPIDDYKNSKEIFEELVYGTGAVMVQCEAGDVFDMTYDSLLDAISENVSAGRFKLDENFVIVDEIDDITYNDMIDSMICAYDEEINFDLNDGPTE